MGRIEIVCAGLVVASVAACSGPGPADVADATLDAPDAATNDGATCDCVLDSPDAVTDAGTDIALDAGPPPHELILHERVETLTPSYVASHLATLDALAFDGVAVYLRNLDLSDNVSFGLMSPGSNFDTATIRSILAPLHGITFHALRHNFALVYSDFVGDLFDDTAWSAAATKFAQLAAALRAEGFEGIFFDNEQGYSGRYWGSCPTPPSYCSSSSAPLCSAHTLAEFQVQARARGRHVMSAMTAVFPDIAILTFHGPYVSEPSSPAPFNGGVAPCNPDLGPFFVGMLEARGAATVVDGGELGNLHTPAEFQSAYDWEKRGIASDATNCAFIPASLRPTWPASISVGAEVYDTPPSGGVFDAATIQTTVTNALRSADRFVWFYTESLAFGLPSSSGGASDAYVQAVRAGRAAVY